MGFSLRGKTSLLGGETSRFGGKRVVRLSWLFPLYLLVSTPTRTRSTSCQIRIDIPPQPRDWTWPISRKRRKRRTFKESPNPCLEGTQQNILLTQWGSNLIHYTYNSPNLTKHWDTWQTSPIQSRVPTRKIRWNSTTFSWLSQILIWTFLEPFVFFILC